MTVIKRITSDRINNTVNIYFIINQVHKFAVFLSIFFELQICNISFTQLKLFVLSETGIAGDFIGRNIINSVIALYSGNFRCKSRYHIHKHHTVCRNIRHHNAEYGRFLHLVSVINSFFNAFFAHFLFHANIV